MTTTNEIAEKIATEHGLTKVQSKAVVEAVFAAVTAAATSGAETSIPGLSTGREEEHRCSSASPGLESAEPFEGQEFVREVAHGPRRVVEKGKRVDPVRAFHSIHYAMLEAHNGVIARLRVDFVHEHRIICDQQPLSTPRRMYPLIGRGRRVLRTADGPWFGSALLGRRNNFLSHMLVARAFHRKNGTT